MRSALVSLYLSLRGGIEHNNCVYKTWEDNVDDLITSKVTTIPTGPAVMFHVYCGRKRGGEVTVRGSNGRGSNGRGSNLEDVSAGVTLQPLRQWLSYIAVTQGAYRIDFNAETHSVSCGD